MDLKVYHIGFRSLENDKLQTLYDSGELVSLADYRALQRAAADLLTYLDEHDWGMVPEGATADKLRDLVHTHAVEKMARFPNCPGCDAEASDSASE
jgi:hypothetical protein